MNVREIPIDQIRISRDRMRDELGDIDALAQSIQTFGLLQPIIVDANLELVGGFRRYTAHRKLGKGTISAVFKDEMDELAYREVELEENAQRLDMSWAERAKCIAEIDRIKRLRNPDWGQTQTAVVAGVKQSQVSDAIKITQMRKLFPEIAEAKSLHQAKSWAQHKAKTVQRIVDVQSNPDVYQDIESLS